MTETPHIRLIKLVSGIQKYSDKYFTDTLDLINQVDIAVR